MAVISVLMTAYNAQEYLGEAIDSIINQTWNDFEFIIVDDGSTDGSLKILNEYKDERIKVIVSEKNGGVAYARNIGLAKCTSKYVAIMDADDVSSLNRLEKQYSFLEKHPEIDGVYAKFKCIKNNGEILQEERPIAYYNYNFVKASMILNNVVANCGMMFKRQIVVDYGLKYDETWKIGSDYKFWCDYIQYGKIVGMNEVLWYYRLRNDSVYNGSDLLDKKKCEKKMKLYNFEIYGLIFTEEEREILIKVFDTQGTIESRNEMILLYDAMLSMVVQLEQSKFDFVKEMKVLCRKRFLEKIETAKGLWK